MIDDEHPNVKPENREAEALVAQFQNALEHGLGGEALNLRRGIVALVSKGLASEKLNRPIPNEGRLRAEQREFVESITEEVYLPAAAGLVDDPPLSNEHSPSQPCGHKYEDGSYCLCENNACGHSAQPTSNFVGFPPDPGPSCTFCGAIMTRYWKCRSCGQSTEPSEPTSGATAKECEFGCTTFQYDLRCPVHKPWVEPIDEEKQRQFREEMQAVEPTTPTELHGKPPATGERRTK